jgi:lipoic acid synthetase
MKPQWLKIELSRNDNFDNIDNTLKKYNLHTVCQEAHCPNISECWNGGTATFMVMGDICTRGCRFCAVKTGKPLALDKDEPHKLAHAIKEWGLDYIVITSVDRDDLPDHGAQHFASCINAVRDANPNILIEVLIPDFRGGEDCIKIIVDAGPDVLAHNIETIKRLQNIRDVRANYQQSLFVLRKAKELGAKYTKSSLMLGLGESEEEIIEAMGDLRKAGVDIITFGQYLRPSSKHIQVGEYVHPAKFQYYKELADNMGFLYCASGPFVRSSYKAGELFLKGLMKGV